MLDSDDFVVENRGLVEWALANYTRSRIDFSDLLISRAGNSLEHLKPSPSILTPLKYVPGMELLK